MACGQPSGNSTRVPGGHCRLLSPHGRPFHKRVLCPRPAARRPAAQAGLFPTQGSSVPSRMAVQAGVAGAKGPLVAQPGSSHRAWGRAGHTPLSRCPAVPGPVGHDCGCPQPFPSWVGKPKHGSSLWCCLGPRQSGQPGGAQRTVCAKPPGKGEGSWLLWEASARPPRVAAGPHPRR